MGRGGSNLVKTILLVNMNRTTVNDVNYNPSALTSDNIIAFTALSAGRNCVISTEDVQSGSATKTRVITVVDEAGGAAVNNITVSLESGNINGAANFVMNTNNESISIYLNGTNGFIF